MSLLLHLDDNIDSLTISLIKAAKDVEPDLEDKDEEENDQQQIMSHKTLCNVCESPNDESGSQEGLGWQRHDV